MGIQFSYKLHISGAYSNHVCPPEIDDFILCKSIINNNEVNYNEEHIVIMILFWQIYFENRDIIKCWFSIFK